MTKADLAVPAVKDRASWAKDTVAASPAMA